MKQAHVIALSGGVGGAKLANGLLHVLPADTLSLILNTGDDFHHLGLHVSPDIDTALYTLGGVANRDTGWGRQNESWQCMAALEQLGGETWFRLGDADLATHILRSQRLQAGDSLSAITADFAHRLGIRARLLPMSDDAVRTRVVTDSGEFAFQDYFVRLQCQPRVERIHFSGVDTARPSQDVLAALQAPELSAIILCPSNPYLSIDPILAVPGLRAALRAAKVPVVAVSPIIAGAAVKGPTAKIMAELGLTSSADAVAAHYADLIDGFVLDERDAALASKIGVAVRCCDTLMLSLDDCRRVAQTTLDFAYSLRSPSGDRQ